MAETPLTPESSAAPEASVVSGEPAINPTSDPGPAPGGEEAVTPVTSGEIPKDAPPETEVPMTLSPPETPAPTASPTQSAEPVPVLEPEPPATAPSPALPRPSPSLPSPPESSTALSTEPIPAGIAARLEVSPQSERPAGGEGGEWEMLLEKGRRWLDAQQIGQQWQNLWGPVRGLGLIVGLILVLRVYGALLGTLEEIPLLPRLLQLIGLLVLARFGLSRLLRTEDRDQVLNDWRQRWQAFRGES